MQMPCNENVNSVKFFFPAFKPVLLNEKLVNFHIISGKLIPKYYYVYVAKNAK